MERVQRAGLIALVLLLGVATASILVSHCGPSAGSSAAEAVFLDAGALPVAELLPPGQRGLAPEDFSQPPVRHPLTGEGSGPSVNDLAAGREPAPAQPAAAFAPEPAPAAAAARDAAARAVRVREGDTLEKIARRELGAGGRWREIAALNGIEDPRQLRVGQLLQLPGAPAAVAVEASAAAGAERTYVVGKGETLSEVSQAVYGTSRHWRLIQEANGISDPSRVRAGQLLRIPPLP